eukprot:1098214-Prorocentrum_minimum.AAC.1
MYPSLSTCRRFSSYQLSAPWVGGFTCGHSHRAPLSACGHVAGSPAVTPNAPLSQHVAMWRFHLRSLPPRPSLSMWPCGGFTCGHSHRAPLSMWPCGSSASRRRKSACEDRRERFMRLIGPS